MAKDKRKSNVIDTSWTDEFDFENMSKYTTKLASDDIDIELSIFYKTPPEELAKIIKNLFKDRPEVRDRMLEVNKQFYGIKDDKNG